MKTMTSLLLIKDVIFSWVAASRLIVVDLLRGRVGPGQGSVDVWENENWKSAN
jgi:hypothetical protein